MQVLGCEHNTLVALGQSSQATKENDNQTTQFTSMQTFLLVDIIETAFDIHACKV
jgi:hypothetical protein